MRQRTHALTHTLAHCYTNLDMKAGDARFRTRIVVRAFERTRTRSCRAAAVEEGWRRSRERATGRAKLKKDGQEGQADRARTRRGEVTAGRVEDERGSRPTPGVSLTRHAPLPRWGTRSTNTQERRCLCVHVACVTRNSSLPTYDRACIRDSTTAIP